MIANSDENDIVIIGHLAKDLIEVDGKTTSAIGGAVYYGALAGNQMNLKIAIITRLKKSDFQILNIFKKKNIDVYPTPTEETSGILNKYTSTNMEFRECFPLGFAGPFTISEIPELDPKFFVIGPIIAGEVELKLFRYLLSKYPHKLCLDIQGFIRTQDQGKLIYKDLKKSIKHEILSNIAVLKLDQIELRVLTSLDEVKEGAEMLKEFGPKEILITHEKGISLLTDNDYFIFPWKNRSSIGRTGRGDTAFISYLGSRIIKNPKESLKFSAALTSLKMESNGAFSLPLNAVNDFIHKEYSD